MIKNKVLLLIIIGLANLMACQTKQKSNNISTILGKWKTNKGEISLYAIERGEVLQLASCKVALDSSFCFGFHHTEAKMFLIGVEKQKKSNYSFYFKPGDRLNVAISDTSYTLIGKNTEENIELEKWHNAILPLELLAVYNLNSTYLNLFPILEEKLPQLESYKSSSTNSDFNRIFNDKRKLDLAYYAGYLVCSPRSAHPQKDNYINYYQTIGLGGIGKTDAIVNYPYGRSLLFFAEFFDQRLNTNQLEEDELAEFCSSLGQIDQKLAMIKDKDAKSLFLMGKLKYIKTYEGYLDFESKYNQHITDQDQLALKEFATNYEMKQGGAAINFTFPNIDGNNVSLSDFKGKLVYIDIWATWCGPCKKELPFYVKLEQKYRNEEVVFLSISIDKPKDLQAWKKAVTDGNLKGVQLFAGNNPKILQTAYKLKGIPRFILIDKEGNLISEDAPRPSSPEIEVLLKSALKK